MGAQARRAPRHRGDWRHADERIRAGIFTDLEHLCPTAVDKRLGLELDNLTVEGRIVTPCAGEAAGRSPADQGQQGAKRSLMIQGHGLPIGFVTAEAIVATRPCGGTPCSRCPASGSTCPPRSQSLKTRDLLNTLGCDHVTAKKGKPLHAEKRTRVIDALLASPTRSSSSASSSTAP